MISRIRLITIVICLLSLSLCLLSCEKKKEGKLVVSEKEFVFRKATTSTFTTSIITLDAKGKIKNVGEVDVKNVVVTGYCRSCSSQWISGQWIITPEIEKMPNQKDIINFIAVGKEESFSFEEIADYKLLVGQTSPEMPEKLEIVIESFEIVEK